MKKESVKHPDHYGGKENPYEAIKVIEAWELNFSLGNVLKYINRSGKKSKNPLEDLEKAAQYLDFEIKRMKNSKSNPEI
tara:strand:- start:17977 stop:18213 length:237 start_codon:yes stop_codon:yes gene_type:complete